MYILEGNIGAGKTTFLKLLSENVPEISVAYEPLDDWQQKFHGQSLLENFYKEPKRWAYSMETFAMLSRVRDHLRDQANSNPFHIIERSIYSGHYVFALNGYENGFMTDLEWYMYCKWFDFLIPGKCKPPRGFIYLKVDPKVAYERLRERGREEESGVPLEYLEQLDECHEKFLIKKDGILPELLKIPVLVLDGNVNFEKNFDEFKTLAQAVQKFLIDHS